MSSAASARVGGRVCGCVWVVASVLGVAPAANAEGSVLSARVECASATGPGRIVCELNVSASSGKLVWVDALVVQAPPFARPLRSRVVLQVGPAGALGTASAKLALVASELGRGELQLRVRGVVCRESPSGESCGPEVVPVVAVVAAGQPAPSPP